MAQVSITSFYRTRRTANVSTIKETRNDAKLGVTEDVAEECGKLLPGAIKHVQDGRIREPAENRTSDKCLSVVATARQSSVKRKSARTRTLAKRNDVHDIRSFLPPSKNSENRSDEALSFGVETSTVRGTGAKRPSSPSHEVDLLSTPKRVRRDVVHDVKSEVGETASVDEQTPTARTPTKMPKRPSMADVRAKLAALKEQTNSLNRRRALFPELSADCAGAETVTIEVPSSPRGFAATLSPSPRKKRAFSAAPPKAAAYQRFCHLLGDTPAVSSADAKAPPAELYRPKDARLELPVSYRSLLESFRALDVIYFMLFNRRDLPIYFEKVKSKVRELSGLAFNEVTLGRIKRAFPESYDLAMEEVVVLEMAGKQKQYHLVLKPKYGVPDVDQQTKTHLSHAVLQERLCEMERRLLELVHEKHEEFLAEKTTKTIPRAEVRHWHPEFVVEAVPGIEPEELPKKPAATKPATAKEVLSMASKDLYHVAPKIIAALENVSFQKEEENARAKDSILSRPCQEQALSTTVRTTAPRAVPKNLLKFNAKLLEKIRAREAEKSIRAVTRTEEEEKRLTKLRRLPDLARLLHGLFVAEKKAVLPFDVIVEKLAYSYPGALSQREIREHIELLGEQMKGEKIANAVPGSPQEEWMRVLTSTNGSKFVRLHKDADVNVLVNALKRKAENAR